jgi:hypothetical protein
MEEQITQEDVKSVKIALAVFAAVFFEVGFLIGMGVGACI